MPEANTDEQKTAVKEFLVRANLHLHKGNLGDVLTCLYMADQIVSKMVSSRQKDA